MRSIPAEHRHGRRARHCASRSASGVASLPLALVLTGLLLLGVSLPGVTAWGSSVAEGRWSAGPSADLNGSPVQTPPNAGSTAGATDTADVADVTDVADEKRPGVARRGGPGAGPAVTPRAARPRPAVPVALRLPDTGVDTTLVRLGLTAEGALEVPTDFARAGWYERGPRPGEPGPAVLAGHYDSTSGPAVFYALDRVRRGHRIEVRRADGSTVRFVVDRIERHAKDAFPTARVYGQVDRPEIRLITCGGTFDRSSRHYRDNVIVFGQLA